MGRERKELHHENQKQRSARPGDLKAQAGPEPGRQCPGDTQVAVTAAGWQGDSPALVIGWFYVPNGLDQGCPSIRLNVILSVCAGDLEALNMTSPPGWGPGIGNLTRAEADPP